MITNIYNYIMLPEDFCKNQYKIFLSTSPKDHTYDIIYDYVINLITENVIKENEIDWLFWEYSSVSNIEYIRVFNIIFPCCYIYTYKSQFVAMIIMLKFMEYKK